MNKVDTSHSLLHSRENSSNYALSLLLVPLQANALAIFKLLFFSHILLKLM